MKTVAAPLSSVLVSLDVEVGQSVNTGQVLGTVEAMKMQYSVKSPVTGEIASIHAEVGATLEQGETVLNIIERESAEGGDASHAEEHGSAHRSDLHQLEQRLAQTEDRCRQDAVARRHTKGYRTARENLDDLIDAGSFNEYGQLAVAAQRTRVAEADLRRETAADGVITGTATVNAAGVGAQAARTAVVINDYTVLAGTQGFFHHHKLDRLLELAEELKLPVVMYTEGGGGRPGDTDVLTNMAGLNVASFKTWARLSGVVPRIAVNNGYCFAGNAALFGCADITVATRTSWIGMAGPAMIEGGGLGQYHPTDIGDIETQSANGVVDLVAEDEAEATRVAKQLLMYFQGDLPHWEEAEQDALRTLVPADRRGAYPVREIVEVVMDRDSFIELRSCYGRGIVTGFARMEGRAVGVLANDCHHLGGAVDAESAEKAARFLQLCDAFALPVVSFADTPGFMVGPDSEKQASVRRMSSLFVTAASISVPMVSVVLRKGYGLGAMAMVGGSTQASVYTVAWPSGEFGAMGLEGAVRLGFKKELEAAENDAKRQAIFDQHLNAMIEKGKAVEAASYLEIDAVIDPLDTRAVILRALKASPASDWRAVQRRNFVDTW